MVNIDKDALVAELKNSTQNPRLVEQAIQKLEQGEFDIQPGKKAAVNKPEEKAKPEVESRPAPETDVERRTGEARSGE